MNSISVNFEDVVYFQEGPGVRNWQFRDSGIKLINIRNLVDSELCLENTNNYLEIEEVETKYKHFLLNEGDFVMASSGVTWGKIAEVHEEHLPLCLNTSIIRLVSKDINKLDKWYLYYYIKSPQFRRQIERLITGSAQPNFGPSHLKKVFINLPDISIQRESVEQFTRLESIINKRQEEIRCLDDLIKARFVELFGNPDTNEKGWNVYTMEQLCKVGSSKRIYQSEQSMTGIPFLRISDLVNKMDNCFDESDLFIPEERFKELKEQGLVPECGDILLTARGTLGRCYIIKEDDEFYFQDGMITWLSDYDEKITALFISYLFEMPGFRKQIDALQAGSTVAYLSISMTKKLDVIVPPIELQNQFADFVKQVDKSKFAVQQSLNKTQQLFDGLMQQYFG